MSEITVTRNESDSRFEARRDGELLGYISYEVEGDVIDLPHTKVFPEYEGQGVGSALVRQTLDQIRAIGDLRVKPTCPFIDIWIKRHKDYHDLVA
ncbi:MAG: N-acetyltransferase [Thermomicrobiales bacterium]|nr:N-acetyltransferase [Thermomicrobiales bacterium]